MTTAVFDMFLRTDHNSPISASSKKLLDDQDIAAEAFGHVFTVISSAGSSIIDLSTRILSKLDGIDKFLKLTSGGLLYVLVRFEKLGEKAPLAFGFAKERIKVVTDTFAGFNLIGRIVEFTKCERDAKGNLRVIFLRDSSVWKIASRALLTVGNVCETIKMFQEWGGKAHVARVSVKFGQMTAAMATRMSFFAAAASKIGQTSVFKYTSKLGVKNTFVIGSCLLSLIDVVAALKKKGDWKDLRKHWEWKDSLVVGNEIGKISLIIGGELLGIAFTYQFAAITMFTSLCALAKIALDDYKKTALDDNKKAAQKPVLAAPAA